MKINKLIDHTLLKPTATTEDIKKLCQEAIEYDFKSVCVNPCHVKIAKELLQGTDVLVCTVVGFPLGANTIKSKVFETLDAVANGVDEVDMVINIGKVKERDFDYLVEEISEVVQAAKGLTVKVIIETCYLTDEEKRLACQAAKKAQAHFVKTSTGFGTGGATVEDVKLMYDEVHPQLEVKASGGVRSLEDLEKMVQAGATRIGTSSGVAIMNKQTTTNNY